MIRPREKEAYSQVLFPLSLLSFQQWPGLEWLTSLFYDSFQPYQRVRMYDAPQNGRGDLITRDKEEYTDRGRTSSMDDPIMWGFLPLRYNFGFSNWNKRWGFGSHDICFQGRYDFVYDLPQRIAQLTTRD